MNRRLKILFFSETLVEGHGGIASYAHDFADAYPEFDITFVSAERYVGEHIEAVNFDGNDLSIGNARRLVEFINSSGAHIVVNSSFQLLSLVTPFLSEEIRVISVSHFIDGRLAYIAGLNAGYADALIALSEESKRRYEKRIAGKAHVIYNFMPPAISTTLQPLSSRPLKIVFPGGSNRFKSADIVYKVLMRLLRTDQPFEFYWIGNTYLAGRRHFRGALTDISECLPEDGRIRMVGRVERGEAIEIIRGADIFLLPSRAEGFPISLCEAMSGRCVPVISDARHGSLDLVENGVTGIVVRQNDVQGYVDAISDILRHPAKYEEIVTRSFEKAEAMLDKAEWRKRMDAVMSGPLEHKPRKQFDRRQYLFARLKLKFVNLFDKSRRNYYMVRNLIFYPLFTQAKINR